MSNLTCGNFNELSAYEKEIEPLLKEVMSKCKEHSVPFIGIVTPAVNGTNNDMATLLAMPYDRAPPFMQLILAIVAGQQLEDSGMQLFGEKLTPKQAENSTSGVMARMQLLLDHLDQKLSEITPPKNIH